MWGHEKALDGGFDMLKFEHDLSLDDRIARLNVMETYAGAGGNPDIHAGWAQAARDRGHNVKRNEIMYQGNPEGGWQDTDLGYMPELPGNILSYTADDVIREFGGKTPDVFYASPPCEGFSQAARHQGWEDWAGEKEKKEQFNLARSRGDARYFMRPEVGPTPGNPQAHRGRGLMNHTLGMIDDLQNYRMNNEGRDADDPMYWWMENPTGMMRYQPELGARTLAQPMQSLSADYPGNYPPPNMKRRANQPPLPSITHSSYSGPFAEALGFDRHDIPGHPSLPSRKPTDLWTNSQNIWTPRPHTRVGDHGGIYHAKAPRGAKTGTQAVTDWTTPEGLRIPKYHMRSLIPYGLGLDTIQSVERAKRGETPRNRLF